MVPNFIKRKLRNLNIMPSKKLGQNFLVDEAALSKIVEASDLYEDDVVIEAGPGLGILTEALLRKSKKVYAFELDFKLFRHLQKKFSGFKNLELQHKNILKVYPENLGISKYKFISNLPYSITSKVLRHFLEDISLKPAGLTVLVQKEVAERICEKPPRMNLLAFGVQLFSKPEVKGIIKASSFWPSPAVDSAILRLNMRKSPRLKGDIKKIFNLARISFQFKRKKLANCLKHSLKLTSEQLKNLYFMAKIPPKARASELDFAKWQELYKILKKQL